MAASDDILRQGDTDTLVFRQTSADTNGAYLEVEATYAPMIDVRPQLHYHPRQDELFRVLHGELSVLVDGEPRSLTAGQDLVVTRGQRHSMWNPGPAPARFLWRTTPALRTEAMFETFWGLVQAGKAGRHGLPRPPLLQSMLLMWAYRNEWRLATPPAAIALPLCAALSVPARALGYRAHYHHDTSGGPS
ncbi:MAG: cupin domain-containing protein [Micromonosporaceae bacterium]|nr:cupin domain-containing protein [Micromonosporaceae bacterium]